MGRRGREEHHFIFFIFLNLEKSGAIAKIMDSINDANRHSVNSQKDILSVQRSYFADLYKKKVGRVNMTAKIDYFMKDTSIPHISEEQRKSCEGALSQSEVPSVLNQMKTGSAPGSDGITADFLKVFWSHVGKLITASFTSAFENSKMSSSQ